jgi:hypothetical protein
VQETSYFLSSEIDLETIILSSQELSSIVEVDELCNSLLNLVVKNLGATKGALILYKDHNLYLQSVMQVSSSSLRAAKNCSYL